MVPSLSQKIAKNEFMTSIAEFSVPYTDDLPDPLNLNQEISMWHTICNTKKETETIKAAYIIAEGSVNFPNVTFLLKLLLTIPVTSATTERANSTLKYIKSKLRSTMAQTTLNACVLGYKHQDLMHKISVHSLTDKFIKMKRRRILLNDPTSE